MIQEISYSSAIFLEIPSFQKIWKKKIWFLVHERCLLNNKCLRDSVNRIQYKFHRIRTYETSKKILSCLNDKIYIQNSGHDGLALGY